MPRFNLEVEKAKLEKAFPKLSSEEYSVVEGTSNYNCIAWSLQLTDCWLWPVPKEHRATFDSVRYDWPADLLVDTKLSTFIELYKKKKYEICDDGCLESGYRKICIYGKNEAEVTHASRQLVACKDEGKWTSKLGKGARITHKDPTSLEGTGYGKVLLYMKCKYP